MAEVTWYCSTTMHKHAWQWLLYIADGACWDLCINEHPSMDALKLFTRQHNWHTLSQQWHTLQAFRSMLEEKMPMHACTLQFRVDPVYHVQVKRLILFANSEDSVNHNVGQLVR